MSRQTSSRSVDEAGLGAGVAGRRTCGALRQIWGTAYEALSPTDRCRPVRDGSTSAGSPEPDQGAPIANPQRHRTANAGYSRSVSEMGVHMRNHCASVIHSLRQLKNGSETPPQVVGVTSCYAGEGVTTVASQLALAAASNGRSVLLADVNFGSPSIHEMFQTDLSPGLAESLQDGQAVAEILCPASGNSVTLVAAGELVGAQHGICVEKMGEFVRFAAENFDFAVFDLPPLSRPADALPVCGLLDGVVLLVEAERVRWPVARRFVTDLARSGAKPLGVVMNKQRQYIPEWLYRRL
jgi:protein-tyrosine kinase